MTDTADPEADPEPDTAAADGETDVTEGGDVPDDAETEADGAAAEDLVAEVAATDESLAGEVERVLEERDELAARVDELEDEVADLESRLKRKQADFQNYKKRAERRREELKERATEDLVERLLDVRDNLVRALEQDDDADIRDGIEATLSTFDRVLDEENVSAIEPAPGDEVDPQLHEVVMRVDADHPAGRIAQVYRPGYRIADKVLRPAQVTVSEGTEDPEE